MTIDFASLDSIRLLRKAGLRPDERLAQKILATGEPMVRTLVELTRDVQLFMRPEPDCYAPIHALRLLGELRSPACVEPLLTISLDNMTGLAENDPNAEILLHETPQVIARAASANPEQLWRYVESPDSRESVVVLALDALGYISGLDPQQRPAITQRLRDHLAAITDTTSQVFITQIAMTLANMGVSEVYRDVMALYRAGRIDTTVFSAAQARQLLLSKPEQRMEAVHLSLWDRYDRFGPFPPEAYDDDEDWDDEE